jgi:hypothetical protein
MPMPELPFDALQIKAQSERQILALGGQICDWLPWVEITEMRSADEIIDRTLITHALLNISFRAPTGIIRDWIDRQGLSGHLSPAERLILDKPNDQLTNQEQANLYWYIDCVWAFLWICSLIPDIPVTRQIDNTMAALLPNLQKNEDSVKFRASARIRSREEIYRMRDLYYRAHWYSRNCQLTGASSGDFNLDSIMERRRALQWTLDRDEEWDNWNQNT